MAPKSPIVPIMRPLSGSAEGMGCILEHHEIVPAAHSMTGSMSTG
jgi:hypothetical protein